jgi:hypothetical protein
VIEFEHLSEAVCDVDAHAEEFRDLGEYLQAIDINPSEALTVAEQRALRAYAIHIGKGVSVRAALKNGKEPIIMVPPEDKIYLSGLKLAWIDGMIAGVKAARKID